MIAFRVENGIVEYRMAMLEGKDTVEWISSWHSLTDGSITPMVQLQYFLWRYKASVNGVMIPKPEAI